MPSGSAPWRVAVMLCLATLMTPGATADMNAFFLETPAAHLGAEKELHFLLRDLDLSKLQAPVCVSIEEPPELPNVQASGECGPNHVFVSASQDHVIIRVCFMVCVKIMVYQ